MKRLNFSARYREDIFQMVDVKSLMMIQSLVKGNERRGLYHPDFLTAGRFMASKKYCMDFSQPGLIRSTLIMMGTLCNGMPFNLINRCSELKELR